MRDLPGCGMTEPNAAVLRKRCMEQEQEIMKLHAKAVLREEALALSDRVRALLEAELAGVHMAVELLRAGGTMGAVQARIDGARDAQT